MPRPAKLATRRGRGALTDGAILAASARLFRARGYDRTNLADVAAELGVTKAALYYHFASKEDLLLACVSAAHARLREELARVDDAAATGRRRVELMLRACMTVTSGDLGGVVADERVMSQRARRLYRELRGALDAALEERISQGVRDGSLVTDDIPTTAAALLGMIAGVCERGPRRSRRGVAEVTERVAALAFDGLAPRAQPPSRPICAA